MSIPRLIPQPPGKIVSGKILYHGQDLLSLPIDEMRKLRGAKIGVIFQEPMTALSPLHKIGFQLGEVFRIHTDASKSAIKEQSLAWLAKVGIPEPERCLNSYPHELSGGMRQRVMIAMAMMLEPEIIIADEPTTALDVTIQAQILELMRKLQSKKSAMLLITHDLGVVWEMCDNVVVMYAAHVVEQGSKAEIFSNPLHPYTRGLLNSIPSLQKKGEALFHIPGQVPSLLKPGPGCPFAPRCPQASTQCKTKFPASQFCSPSHSVACVAIQK